MKAYKVKGTTILHNGSVYAEGTTIELDEPHSTQLADYLEAVQVTGTEPVPETKAQPAKSRPSRSSKPKTDNNTINAPTETTPVEQKAEQEKQEAVVEQPKTPPPAIIQTFVPPNMRKE